MSARSVGRMALVGMLVTSSLSAQDTSTARPASVIPTKLTLRVPTQGMAFRQRVLQRPISLDLRNATVEEALQRISSLSRVDISYSSDLIPLGKRVSLRIENGSVSQALSQVLAGESLRILVGPSGQIVIAPAQPKADEHAESGEASQGTINGRVTDTDNGQPVSGAQVIVVGTDYGALARDDGRYAIQGVPSGDYEIQAQRIGYRSQSQTVSVPATGTVTLNFTLASEPTRLEELVVTATGNQRRVELGNVVGTIAADSLVGAAPIRNLTDAIGARVPGVQLVQNSGFTGDAPRMRIRGISSVSLSRQPLLYVDGIRVDNSTTSGYDPLNTFIANYGQRAGHFNDFNLDDVESIEIVKGPSAATLYGTDAANGVILITTKRGLPGEARWSFYAEGGILRPAVDFPDNYFSAAANTPSDEPERCVLLQQASGACTVDRLMKFSPLNDPELSPIGTGTRTQFGAQVSGGVERFRYFLSGDYEQETGYLEIPDFYVDKLQQERGGAEIPEWQIRPNALHKVSFRANATTTIGENGEISLASGLTTGHTRIPRGNIFTAGYWGEGYRDASDGWYSFYGGPAQTFAVRRDEDLKHYTASLSSNWRVLPWLTFRGTAGVDFSSSYFDGVQRRGEGVLGHAETGRRTNIRDDITLYTVDVGSSASFDLTPTLSSRTAVGLQYNRREQGTTIASATGLPPGSKTVTGAASIDSQEGTVESVVAGAYVEETLGLNDRLFVTGALRTDGASNFGRNFQTAVYPKASLSWLLSNEPFFPEMSAVNSLRLRAAYGTSGVQPGSTDALALLDLVTSGVDGSLTNGAVLSAIGNPDLKPERQAEFEAGLDAQLFDNRLSIEATYYNRLSTDALIDRPLPTSVGVFNRWDNIGSVRNRGFEALVGARLVDNGWLSWDVSLNGSINHNRLEKLDVVDLTFIGGNPASRSRQGYPLFARWDRPILSFDDANGNSIIELDEVVVGDTIAYLGEAHPPRQLTASTTLSLFGDRLLISSQFDYRGGHLGINFTELNKCVGFDACRAVNDPAAPLWEQARSVAYHKTGTWAGYMEDASFTRWRELAVTFRAPESLAARLGARGLSVTLSGRNLTLWTDYTSPDPEVNSAPGLDILEGQSDNPTMPQTRYWTLRVNYDM